MSLPLLYDKHGEIAVITLNRPESRNAISPEVACRLADAFADFAADDALRVAILTGAGDRAFCSGGDLALTLPLMTGARTPETEWDRRLLAEPEVMARSALRDFELNKPIIAAVNGACMAGGMETVLATDIRLAAAHATFALPEAKRAVIPFAGSLVRLPRQIHHCVAMEMLLTGDALDAEAAREAGLINRVVPAEQLMDRSWDIARRIAANGPVAVQQIKRTVLASSGRTLAEGYALEDQAKATVMATDDAREGPRAFMEKRPARFVGR
ncbi:enoyl-CoA hydratase/isomerase family protein [Wenxinia marina]|uniref:Short chain enoyl-CoA hydratase n=1 Tax=Wenxinia marina DSM 24838 TaxID=1123501 RepID=A0A0D0QC13_9RHOB|nr:enoyl-CoA hydratase-related protein [Wenxinia marina]KIQ69837.1 short chain enoyl-CoA hydratase [Wenxinia marina DSM 24838]GGL61618.1 putative enoyl-CoA hydratase/isomerase [Wenxinia marina]